MERWYLLITVPESSYFELSGDGKYGYFLSLKVDGKMIFTDYWKVLVLSLEKFLFWNFGDGKYGHFLRQKVDEKVMFTWSFWAFQDIPGPGKYGFSCSVERRM